MRATRPLRFIVLLGVVSLFADTTYEGARSATGPFFAMLGASAFAVALVSAGGELIDYALRLWSGRLVGRTQQYWTIASLGYAVNLLAVPLLALAANWPVAATLILVERAGKALRPPAKDAMLSYASAHTGRGWGFGLHKALDQVGATLGQSGLRILVVRGDGNHGWLYSRSLTAVWRSPWPRRLQPCPCSSASLAPTDEDRALPYSIHGVARGDTRWRLPSHTCSRRSSSAQASSCSPCG